MPAKKTNPKKAASADAWAWLTKAQVAAVVGHSIRNFSERIQPRLEANATRGKGATLRFDVRAVVRALAAYVAEQHRPKPEDADPLLGDEQETSDALEQYRREATIEKRLKNANTRRELVDRRRVLDAISTGFAAAASCGKKLELRFGPVAKDLWNEGVGAMRDAARTALTTDEEDDGDGGD